jgi:hypothetical protein
MAYGGLVVIIGKPGLVSVAQEVAEVPPRLRLRILKKNVADVCYRAGQAIIVRRDNEEHHLPFRSLSMPIIHQDTMPQEHKATCSVLCGIRRAAILTTKSAKLH